jgi:hypothetical protein
MFEMVKNSPFLMVYLVFGTIAAVSLGLAALEYFGGVRFE